MITKPVKYTEAFVNRELSDMISELFNDQSIVFVGQLFESRNYSRQRFSEWVEKFQNNREISDKIQKIDSLLETRLVLGGLDSTFNPALTIFVLKNKHGWQDVKQVENTHEIKPILGGISNGLPSNNSDSKVIDITEED